MKVYQLESFSPDSPFLERDQQISSPGVNEIQVKVVATSVNPIDTKVRDGLVPAISPDIPAVIHSDLSGEVVAVGAAVTQFKIGDKVYGCAAGFKGLNGALAERVNVPASLMALAPKSIPLAEAAGIPLVAITAWQGLFDKAHIGLGQTVLIHGGCGGVGHMAIQLAKLAGAEVSTTVSSENKAQLAASLGADHVIAYQQEKPEEYVSRLTAGKGFDVVMDTVGGHNLDASFQAVKSQGQVVTIAARSQHDLTPMHGKGASLHMVFMLTPLLTGEGREHFSSILSKLQRLVDQNKLKLLVDPAKFSFSQAAQAHEFLKSGKQLGKVLLRTDL